MRPVPVRKAHPVVLCEFKATARAGIGHYLDARNSLRIELVVPRRVERVGPVDPFAVAADLDHLGAACIGLAIRMRRTAYITAGADRSGELRLSGIGDIVLTHLAGAPTGDVEKLAIHRPA